MGMELEMEMDIPAPEELQWLESIALLPDEGEEEEEFSMEHDGDAAAIAFDDHEADGDEQNRLQSEVTGIAHAFISLDEIPTRCTLSLYQWTSLSS